MGCCVSVPNDEVTTTDKNKKPVFLPLENRAPPSAEEETVKEVLSEVSKPRPVMSVDDVMKQVAEARDLMKTALKNVDEKRYDAVEEVAAEVKESVKKRREVESSKNEEEMSEVSEICSLTMSESVSTTTAKSVADDGGEVRQNRRQRISGSPARIPARNRLTSHSPSRKTEQSPVKRTVNNGSSVRLASTSHHNESTRVRRVGLAPDPRRRDPGESSGRRSRSPATTRSGTVNRSPSRRATATQSPGRVRSEPNERGGSRRLEGKIGINKNENNKNRNTSSTTTKESLENPLVSLECFIFL